jgi:hypothetical protein
MSYHFLFVQFEFTHAPGPYAGRYVVEAGAEANGSGRMTLDPALDTRNRELAGVSRGVGFADVLVVGVVGASTAGARGLLRKAHPVKSDTTPASVPLAVITYVKGTEAFTNPTTAAGRLDRIRYSAAEQEEWVARGLEVLNLAIRAHRIGAPDPYAVEVTRRDARLIRIGYGSTDEVREGRFTDALELPPPAPGKPKRAERLRPSEAVAAVLVGRRHLFDSEELLLRALIDLDQGRSRAAAMQIGCAMRLLCSEVGELSDRHGLDLGLLGERDRDAQRLAGLAVTGSLEPGQIAELDTVVDDVRAVIDAWRYQEQMSLQKE